MHGVFLLINCTYHPRICSHEGFTECLRWKGTFYSYSIVDRDIGFSNNVILSHEREAQSRNVLQYFYNSQSWKRNLECVEMCFVFLSGYEGVNFYGYSSQSFEKETHCIDSDFFSGCEGDILRLRWGGHLPRIRHFSLSLHGNHLGRGTLWRGETPMTIDYLCPFNS